MTWIRAPCVDADPDGDVSAVRRPSTRHRPLGVQRDAARARRGGGDDDRLPGHGASVGSTLREEYLATATFWFESFQNWQSEFLAIASMVWLSVYLRQRWSPESKLVHAVIKKRATERPGIHAVPTRFRTRHRMPCCRISPTPGRSRSPSAGCAPTRPGRPCCTVTSRCAESHVIENTLLRASLPARRRPRLELGRQRRGLRDGVAAAGRRCS